MSCALLAPSLAPSFFLDSESATVPPLPLSLGSSWSHTAMDALYNGAFFSLILLSHLATIDFVPYDSRRPMCPQSVLPLGG